MKNLELLLVKPIYEVMKNLDGIVCMIFPSFPLPSSYTLPSTYIPGT